MPKVIILVLYILNRKLFPIKIDYLTKKDRKIVKIYIQNAKTILLLQLYNESAVYRRKNAGPVELREGLRVPRIGCEKKSVSTSFW